MKFVTLVIARNLCYQPASLSVNEAMIRNNDDRRDGSNRRSRATSASSLRPPSGRSRPFPGDGEGRRSEASPRPQNREKGENRIAKVMARAGLCSRREAEDWIAAGRVAVNGGTISSPAINVTARDRVTVDGEPLPRRERTRLFLYHKPAGLVTTNADPEGRPTLFDALPKSLPRLMSVGRLDIGTEGLLLLTNDGGLARELELPETAWVRRYRVRAHGRVSQRDLDTLRDGVTVDGIHYGPVEASLEREQGANVWLSFAIREGKNREVRNVLAHLGLAVNRLIRVEFGPFGLGELPEGALEEVETSNLRAQLGPRLAARAGCDFSGPAVRPPEPDREERRKQRHALRERLRDSRGVRAPDRDRDAPEKPPGRPRRGHAWRQDDAPLRRTYRGSRRDDLKIEDEARPDKRTGVTTDRSGRTIVVERFGPAKQKPKAAETPARQRLRGRSPPRDRASGPRPSRPGSGERGDRANSERPRKFAGHDSKAGRHAPRPHGQRPKPLRSDDDRDGFARPRKSGFRSDGRRDDRPESRGPRPHRQGPSKPRPSRPQPPRKR
jgi:23S rRNA pseudouridine2605 synthase